MVRADRPENRGSDMAACGFADIIPPEKQALFHVCPLENYQTINRTNQWSISNGMTKKTRWQPVQELYMAHDWEQFYRAKNSRQYNCERFDNIYVVWYTFEIRNCFWFITHTRDFL